MTTLRVLVAVALTSVVVGATASPALAHEGKGVIAVEAETATGPSSTSYTIRLTWENDGHPAIDSTVTATAIDAQGAAETPVEMTPLDQDGRYQANIVFPVPGRWTVRFTAVTPTDTLDVTRDVAQPSTTTTTTPTTSAPSATAIDSTGDPDKESDGDKAGILFAATVVVIATVALALVFNRSGRRLRDDQ